ncbi:MAG: AraC family transcriptional regulator [Stenotrophobium sp.]
MDWQFPRSIYSVSLMCSAAEEHGLKVEQCLAGSGIQSAALIDPATEILPEQELIVIGNIVQRLDNRSGIGLEVGARFHISVYGVLAFALASCGTLRELMRLGERYSQLAFSLTDKRYEENNQEFRVIFEDKHLPRDLRNAVVERDMSAITNVFTELFSSRFPACRLLLRQTRPACTTPFLERFGVVPEFGEEQNVLIADVGILDLPLPQANPQALHFWDAQLQTLLTARQARTGISGKVRKLLSHKPCEAPDMEGVAAELSTTSRHLRRLLAAEGTSFRALADELRETMAEELLTTARLTVEQVADRLGYAEVSSFSNAFKRWKGMPPREWRSANRKNGTVHLQPSAG